MPIISHISMTMITYIQRTALAGCFLFLLLACQNSAAPGDQLPEQPRGSLFIIGGGSRPPEMIRDLCHLAMGDDSGTIFIFTQASAEPDTSFYYAALQFRKEGYDRVRHVYQGAGQETESALLDSIRRGALLYLAGGDQSRFMERVDGTPLYDALKDAYVNGAVIAGTSAGAAVMSEVMITGDQKRVPEYTGDFRTIEADNMILAKGMGFLDSAVIDQHFIRRMRFNRLLSVVLENPELTGFGIDESTALFVEGHRGRVFGEGQVLVVRTHPGSVRTERGLLGARDIRLDLLLQGDTIHW